MKGNAKVAIGDLTANKDLEAEGIADRQAGEVKEEVGKAEIQVGEAIVTDWVRPLAMGGQCVMAKTTDDVLDEVPLFAGLSKDDLREVGRQATRLTLPRGSELTRQGSIGREFIIVLEGIVDVLINDEPVATCGAGDFFGEIALLEDGQRVATVVAKTDVIVDVVNRGEFCTLVAEYPQIGETIRAAMEQRLSENAAHEGETGSSYS